MNHGPRQLPEWSRTKPPEITEDEVDILAHTDRPRLWKTAMRLTVWMAEPTEETVAINSPSDAPWLLYNLINDCLELADAVKVDGHCQGTPNRVSLNLAASDRKRKGRGTVGRSKAMLFGSKEPPHLAYRMILRTES
ncbi:hypothetical protein BHE74_00010134 [Ensete ventricosum]|nr:hypothetical protein BHE74_00010134 [Ensete ventricosum]RZS08050.1 hypothetical protein BHM03_00038982 [Ensete ventricosum]